MVRVDAQIIHITQASPQMRWNLSITSIRARVYLSKLLWTLHIFHHTNLEDKAQQVVQI